MANSCHFTMQASARAIIDIKAPATMELTVYADMIMGAIITGDPGNTELLALAPPPRRSGHSRSRSRSPSGDTPSSGGARALHRWYEDRRAVMRRDTGGKGKRDGDAATGAGNVDAATGAGRAYATKGAGKVDAATGAGIVDAATGDGIGKGSDGKGKGCKDKDAAKDKGGDGDGKGNDGKGKDGKDGTGKGIGKDKDAEKGTRGVAITVPVLEDTVPEATGAGSGDIVHF